MSLTTVQLLLLENLTYTYDAGFYYNYIQCYEGLTIEDFLDSMDEFYLEGLKTGTSGMNAKDWSRIVRAVRRDITLCDMEIGTTYHDPDGKGFSAVFLDHTNGEAVVAFKGTQNALEWEDNFKGATRTTGSDGVSTKLQENALAWYRQAYDLLELDDYKVTIIGHSKGGNKAKYITILDDRIDRCVSFDGQGFSDLFVRQYREQINSRKGRIHNHNVDCDFVNILLNDIGHIDIYRGFDIVPVKDGGIGYLENHCPNTFLRFGESGVPEMLIAVKGRGAGLELGDQFLNSIIRSLTPVEIDHLADFICQVVVYSREGSLEEMFMEMDDTDKSGSDKDNAETDKTNSLVSFLLPVIELALKDEYYETIAYLLAFLLEYMREIPDLKTLLVDILTYHGLGKMVLAGKAAGGMIQSTFYNALLKGLLQGSRKVPDFAKEQLTAMVRNYLKVELDEKQVMQVLDFLSLVVHKQDQISRIPNGWDIH